MAMAAAVVLRGEERVSQRATVLFPFFSTLVLPFVVLPFLIYIYSSSFDIQLALCDLFGALSSFLLLSFLPAFSEKKWLLYLLLGPLSFDKVLLDF